MRQRIYISGPISRGCLQANIDRAREAAMQLIDAGYAPLCPQLTCFLESNEPSVHAGFPHDTWMEVDYPWVAASDALIRLPGESRGADREVAWANTHGVPVYFSVQNLLDRPPAKGDERFLNLLHAMARLHKLKAADYGVNGDPFKNVRQSAEFGVAPWKAAMIRGNDKMVRIQKFACDGFLANESVEDSMLDLSAYALISLILFREEHAAGSAGSLTTREID